MQGMRSSKMSDFLQIGQDLAELWPFENLSKNIPFLLIFQNDLEKTLYNSIKS